MFYDLPAGFLVFILDSEFWDVYNLCIYYGYNFVHSFFNSVHLMLFYSMPEIDYVARYCLDHRFLVFFYCIQDIYNH